MRNNISGSKIFPLITISKAITLLSKQNLCACLVAPDDQNENTNMQFEENNEQDGCTPCEAEEKPLGQNNILFSDPKKLTYSSK